MFGKFIAGFAYPQIDAILFTLPVLLAFVAGYYATRFILLSTDKMKTIVGKTFLRNEYRCWFLSSFFSLIALAYYLITDQDRWDVFMYIAIMNGMFGVMKKRALLKLDKQ